MKLIIKRGFCCFQMVNGPRITEDWYEWNVCVGSN